MNKFLSIIVLLLASTAFAQEVSPLRKRMSADAVMSAKDIIRQNEEIIRQNESTPIIMPYGGYALVPMEVTGKPFIVPGSDNCLFIQTIPKGKAYSGWFVSKDKPGVFSFKTITPDDKYDRVLVHGITNGKQTILWHAMVDGESVIIDAKFFQVGDKLPDPVDPPKPPPVDPTDVLVLAAKKDITNGNGSIPAVNDYAMLCSTFAKQLTDGKQFTNVGEFVTYMKNAGNALLGDTSKVLPTLRRAVGDEINAKLIRDPGAAVDKAYRDSAAIVLNSISQRIQAGVK